jgi:pre-mRNA-splicing factor 18
MELLQAEINRKRKVSAAQIDEINFNQKVGQTRYFRQGDLKVLEEEKRRSKQQEIDAKRAQLVQEEVHVEEKESARVLRETAFDKAKVLDNLSTLDVKEIKRRLRSLMHPITLFGESDDERVTRLSVVLSEDVDEDDYRLTANYNIGNQKTKERRLKDAQEEEEEDEEDYEDDGPSKNASRKEEEQTTQGGESEAQSSSGGDAGEKEETGHSGSFQKGNIMTNYSSTPGLSNQKIIHKYFRNLLKQWEWDLDDRDDVIKRTSKGKMETRTQKQCKDYIRPLFKLCKKDEIPWDISEKLVKVTLLTARQLNTTFTQPLCDTIF